MNYEPGDPQAIVDTVIALDIGFTALLSAVCQHADIAHETAAVLAGSIKTARNEFPGNTGAGIVVRLQNWVDQIEKAKRQ